MPNFINRRYEISIDDQVFITGGEGRQFRVTFEILHDFGGFNSFCDIAINNLTYSTAAKAFKKGSKISIRAGYEDFEDIIFTGFVKNILRESANPGIITRIVCKSGTVEPKSINKTMGVGVGVVTAFKEIAAAMGYPLIINSSDFADTPKFKTGKSLNGDPRAILDEMANSYGFNYIVENGKLIIVKNGKTRNTTPHIVSQFTGMEGIPEITEIGVDVVVRLEPKLKIGGVITIESKFKTFNFSNIYYQDVKESDGTGNYKIMKIAHSGDSHGDTWSTRITGIRVDI